MTENAKTKQNKFWNSNSLYLSTIKGATVAMRDKKTKIGIIKNCLCQKYVVRQHINDDILKLKFLPKLFFISK